MNTSAAHHLTDKLRNVRSFDSHNPTNWRSRSRVAVGGHQVGGGVMVAIKLSGNFGYDCNCSNPNCEHPEGDCPFRAYGKSGMCLACEEKAKEAIDE